MTTIDNMGGILSAQYIFLSELLSFNTFGKTCTIPLKPNAQWKEISSKREGIAIGVTAKREDAGLVYTITGNIQIKHDHAALSRLAVDPYLIIAYQTPDTAIHVIGTDQYPLLATLKPLTPASPTAFSGYELAIEGKQLFAPPLLLI